MDSSYAFGWPGFGDSDGQTDFNFNFAQSAEQPAIFPLGISSVAPHMLQAYPNHTRASLASPSTTGTPETSQASLFFASSSANAATQPTTNGTAACAGCRMRRVKCVRPASNEEDACAACQKKGIRCLPVAPKPKGKRKYGDRAGDRIQAARAQCGSIREGSPRSSLSPASLASRLDDTQTQATLCASLVDDYYRCAYVIQPCVNFVELRYRFAAAGYRSNSLDTPMQALLAVILAIASRVTNHPTVIGHNPDTSSSSDLDVDHSPSGGRRDQFCRQLCSEAEEKLEQGGLLATPSAGTIAARYLLGSFYLFTDKSKESQSRQLTSSAISHLRQLYEDGQASDTCDSLYSGMADYALYVSDALFSAKTGRGLQVTDGDLHLFLFEAHYKYDDLNVEIVQDIAANPFDRVSVGKFAQRMWFQLISLGRSLVSTITGTQASKSPLKVESFVSFWSRCDSLLEWTDNARHMLVKDTPAKQHLELARCCLASFNLACYNTLKRHKEPGLEAMLEQAQKRVQKAAVALAEHLEMMLSFSSNITLATSSQLFQSDIDEWILHLRAAPSAEENGCMEGGTMDLCFVHDAGYTIQRKMQLITAVITACRAFSFSWPDMAPRIIALTAYRTELESLASTTLYQPR